MVDFSLEALAPGASPNPLPLQQKLRRGSPGEISSLAGQFAAAAGDTEAAGAYNQRAKTLAEQGYTVDDKGIAPTEAATTKKVLSSSGTNMMAIARKLNDISNSLQTHTNAANTAVSGVRTTLHGIAAKYNAEVNKIRDLPPSEFENRRAQVEQACRTVALQKIGEAGRTVQAAVTSYEGSLGGAQKTLSALGYAPPTGLNTGGNPADVAIPPPGTDPKKVAAWWKTVDQTQRDYLVGHKYRELGNTNGVPATWRDKANRRALEEDLHSRNTPVLNTARKIQEALAAREKNHGRNEVFLLAYEAAAYDDLKYKDGVPYAESRFAISIGNVDTADNINVVVPGIDTTSADAGSVSWKAHQVHQSAQAADPAKSNATVAWFGYDPPNKADDGVVGIWDTWHDDKAKAGGRNLADDIAGYQANRTTGAHVTAIGHSYGSTVVAQAARNNNLDADDLVLAGSIGPGKGIDHATDLDNAQHRYHVYAGTDSADTTEDLGGDHGADPVSKEFGATRFKAEYNGTTNPHSAYFDDGSESLSNIGKIAAGAGLRDTDTAPYAGWTTAESPVTGNKRDVYVDPEATREPKPVPTRPAK